MVKGENGVNFFKELVEDFPEAIFTADNNRKLTYVNGRALEMLGYASKQDALGRDIFEFVHTTEHERARRNVELRMTGELLGPIRYTMVREDGSTVPVLLHVTPLRSDGEITGIKGVIVDISGQARTEDALKKSENKFRTLFEQNPHGIFYQRSDGRLIDVNERALSLFGLTRDRFLGRTSLDSNWRVLREDGSELPGEEHPSMVSLRTGKPVRNAVVGVYNPQIKQYLWVNVDAIPQFRDGEAAPYQTFVTLSDITDKRTFETALKESEQKYRDLFENMISGVALHEIVLDNSGVPIDYVFLEANDAFESLTGLCKNQIIGKRVTEALPGIENDPADWIGRYGRVALTGEEARFEQYAEPIKKYFSIVAFSPSKGRFATIFEDITDRKATEAALRQSQEKFHTLFVTSPFGICLTSLEEGRIVEVNDAFCEMTGYTKSELIGNTSLDTKMWVDKKDRDETVSKIKEGRSTVKGEYLFKCKHGRPIHAIYISRIITLNDERYILSSFNDVTQTRQLEEQLRHAQKMESVGRLAGGVAHDFNNMLGIIIGHVEMAEESIHPDAPAFENLSEIQTAAERAANLTRQLLAFARKQAATPKVQNLNDAVGDMLGMLRRLIGEEIQLDWRPCKRPCSISIDPSQIDQIVVNLCINSKDAISGGGTITIRTDIVTIDKAAAVRLSGLGPGEFVLLTVTDDGKGMDEETRSHIFEPFFTTKEVGKGTGLGLSTIYGIVKQNRGCVSIESARDKGTTVSIYLPAHLADDVSLPRANPPKIIAEDKETILLVEDENAVLKMTELMLTWYGFHVISANKPSDALRLASCFSGTIDLLITDVVMPEMNGRQLADALRGISPSAKHLFVSGYTADVLAPKGILDKEINFIEKPYTKHQLYEKVRQVLDCTSPFYCPD